MTSRYALLPVLLLAMAQSGCMPTDVSEFERQRGLCDHLRGELPDPEESELLAEAVDAINQQCRGTDDQLRSLKQKYQGRESLRARLDQYEPDIEPTQHASSPAAVKKDQ
jgi:hypothetical protein